MLIELMRECRNFFVIASTCGAFTLSGGTLTPCPVLGDEYIIMTGSASADGLYRLSGNTLLDPDTGEQADVPNQTFTGTIMTCRLPSDFLRLSADIAAYDAAAPAGGVVSESFGGYSRTMATGANGAPVTWREVFARRMTPFRRMFSEVSA